MCKGVDRPEKYIMDIPHVEPRRLESVLLTLGPELNQVLRQYETFDAARQLQHRQRERRREMRIAREIAERREQEEHTNIKKKKKNND